MLPQVRRNRLILLASRRRLFTLRDSDERFRRSISTRPAGTAHVRRHRPSVLGVDVGPPTRRQTFEMNQITHANIGERRVSVCMATFNGRAFVEEQLRSVLEQLSASDEIVVVDDCSSDGTAEVVRKLSLDDPRISLHQNDANVGVIRSFERSLSLAKGAYIFLCDQDDIWLPNKISTYSTLLDANERTSAILGNAEIYVNNTPTGRFFFPNNYSPRLSISRQLAKNDFIGCCMCIRRNVLLRALPFPAGISMHDWWLGCAALSTGAVTYDKRPAILYRRHQNNLSPSTRRSLLKVLYSRCRNFLALAKLLWRSIRVGRTS